MTHKTPKVDPALTYPDYDYEGRHLGHIRNLPVKLYRTREAFVAQFRETLQSHNLTDQQFRVLRALGRYDMLENGQLVKISALLGPSLSRILRDLEKRGLVLREPMASDARAVCNSLTPEAHALVEEIIPKFDPLYEALSQHLTKDDVADLNRLLDKLLSSLQNIKFCPSQTGKQAKDQQ